MSYQHDDGRGLTPDEERAFAITLSEQRPTPTPLFRGALGRRIATMDEGYDHRPAGLWWRAGLLAGAGAVLIVLGALISVGAL